MKKISYLFALIFAAGLFSCVNDDGDSQTGNNNEGGLLTVKNRAVAYALGEGATTPYTVGLSAFQGEEKTVTVEVYNQFTDITDPAAPVLSNKVLLKTLTFPVTEQLENLDFAVTYNELIAGLSVNGAALSASDADLNVGDFWTLSYVAVTNTGKRHLNVTVTKITISCVSNLGGDYAMSSRRSTGTTVYTFPVDTWTMTEPGSYKTGHIALYYGGLAQTPGSPNTAPLPQATSGGYTLTDICGQIKIEDQNLGSVYTNIVSQSPAQYALSTVNTTTGVITVHYSISFASGVQDWISTYTPL